MSQNGYAKQLQLWQEGPVGDSVVIMCEKYTYGNDFDQVMYSTLHLVCNTDDHTHFFNDVFNIERHRWSSLLNFRTCMSKQQILKDVYDSWKKLSPVTNTQSSPTPPRLPRSMLGSSCIIIFSLFNSQEVKPRYVFVLNLYCRQFTSPLRWTECKLKYQQRK